MSSCQCLGSVSRQITIAQSFALRAAAFCAGHDSTMQEVVASVRPTNMTLPSTITGPLPQASTSFSRSGRSWRPIPPREPHLARVVGDGRPFVSTCQSNRGTKGADLIRREPNMLAIPPGPRTLTPPHSRKQRYKKRVNTVCNNPARPASQSGRDIREPPARRLLANHFLCSHARAEKFET